MVHILYVYLLNFFYIARVFFYHLQLDDSLIQNLIDIGFLQADPFFFILTEN
jgi:hypothetical protein